MLRMTVESSRTQTESGWLIINHPSLNARMELGEARHAVILPDGMPDGFGYGRMPESSMELTVIRQLRVCILRPSATNDKPSDQVTQWSRFGPTSELQIRMVMA